MDIREISVKVDAGGAGQKVTINGTSAQSAAITLRPTTPTSAGDITQDVLLFVTVDCFLRVGASPTALADGTDLALPAGLYRLAGIASGQKLAFITSGAAGFAYIYPGA